MTEVVPVPSYENDRSQEVHLEADPNWHHVAREAWTAFCESPLRTYHERTDYVHAWVTCELIDSVLRDGMSAGKSMQLRMYLNDLGFTEGARRALDMQITRTTEAPDPKKVVAQQRLENARRAREAQ